MKKANISHKPMSIDDDDDIVVLAAPPTEPPKYFDYDKSPLKFEIIGPLGDKFTITCNKLHLEHDVHLHLSRLIKGHGRIEGQARLLSHYLLDWFANFGTDE